MGYVITGMFHLKSNIHYKIEQVIFKMIKSKLELCFSVYDKEVKKEDFALLFIQLTSYNFYQNLS